MCGLANTMVTSVKLTVIMEMLWCSNRLKAPVPEVSGFTALKSIELHLSDPIIKYLYSYIKIQYLIYSY